MGRILSYVPFSLHKEIQPQSHSVFQAVHRILNHKLSLVPGEASSFPSTRIFMNSGSLRIAVKGHMFYSLLTLQIADTISKVSRSCGIRSCSGQDSAPGKAGMFAEADSLLPCACVAPSMVHLQ